MAVENEGAAPASPETPSLTPQEQASVEKGQQGLSEVNPLAPVQNSSVPQRPENVPEKFWDAEKGAVRTDALLQSYTELEKTRGAPKEEAQAEAPVSPDGKITKPEEKPAGAEEAPTAAPLADIIGTFATEFADTGDVTGETADALEAAGISKDMQRIYIAGLQALQTQMTTSAHGFVGGEQNYNEMVRWAASNLADKDIDAFNEALDNTELRETAIRGMYARFRQVAPSEGKMITNTSGQGMGDVYTDSKQLLADQRDPRYASDALYRQGVMEKLQRSQDANSMKPVADNGWTAKMAFGR